MTERSLIERFEEKMLRSPSDEASLIVLHALPGCHSDSMLLSRRLEYDRLVRHHVETGLTHLKFNFDV